jgi:competence ComEA-like helix-hairpin-helix protein
VEGKGSWEDAVEDVGEPLTEDVELIDGMAADEAGEVPQEDNEDLPAWMKEAGWDISEGKEETPPPPIVFEDEEESAPSTEPAAGEIPDWLKAMAPPGTLEESLDDDQSVDDLLPWLEEASAQKREDLQLEELLAGSKPLPPDNEEEVETPDWLKDLEPASEAPDQEFASIESDLDLPDWMVEDAQDAKAEMEHSAAAVPTGELEDELPDWLVETSSSTPEAEESGGEVPTWLAELGAGSETADDEGQDAIDEAAPAEEIPNWLTNLQPEGEAKGVELAAEEDGEPAAGEAGLFEGMSLEDEDATMAWLESLAAKQGASEEELISKPEDRDSNLPEWLLEDVEEAGLSAEAALETGAEDANAALTDAAAEPRAASELDEELQEWLVEEAPQSAAVGEAAWLAGLEAETNVVHTEDSGESVEDLPDEDIPDWLAELEAEDGIGALDEAAPADEIPDWLAQLEPEETDQVDQEVVEASAMDNEDEPQLEGLFEGKSLRKEIASMALMADLAAQQGDSDEEVTSKPEDREADLPDWLPAEEDEPEPVQPEAEPENSEWIFEAEPEMEEAGADAALADIPAWMMESTVEAAGKPETDFIPEIPNLQDEAQNEAGPLEVFIPQVPDLKAELASEEDGQDLFVPETPDLQTGEAASKEGLFEGLSLEDEDATMAWLESLAAKQGASEEEFISRPETRQEAMPDWVQEQANVEGAGPADLPQKDTDLEDTKPVRIRLDDDAPQAEFAEYPAVDEQPQEAVEAEISEKITIAEIYEQETPAVEAYPGEEIVQPEKAEEPADSTGLDQPDPVTEAEEAQTDTIAALEPELPDWLSEPVEGEEAEPELPGWLSEPTQALEELALLEEQPVQEEAAAEAEPDLPDWLAEPAEAEDEAEDYAWMPPIAAEERSVLEPEKPVITALDLNSASLVELEKLPGVGFRLAQSIVDYRQRYGRFQKTDDLLNVPGFEPNLLEELGPRLKTAAQPEEQLPIPRMETRAASDTERGQLAEAREAMLKGNLSEGLEHYTGLIKEERLLDEVIRDLQDALYRYPVEIEIWQALGDAYMRSNQLQEALEAYIRAEEILR